MSALDTSMRTNMLLRGAATICLGLSAFVTSAQEVVRYIHTDALGSPVAESDEGGNIVARFAYEPYGGSVGAGIEDGPGFTGHVSDKSTGLTYMQQRYYDPDVAQFLSVDAVTATSDPVGSFGRYRYANSNPYRFIDPDGRQGCSLGTRICMSEGALKAAIAKLNAESPMQANATKPDAVASFRSNARPLQAASNREISANMEERNSSDYRVVDYAYSSGDGARNEAPVTVYGGSYTWSGILHTHPEVHKGYQLSGAGASGKNGRYRNVGFTDASDVAAAFQKNVDVYVVPPSGPSRWLDLRAWKKAVSNAKPDEVIYAGWYEKDI